MRSKQLLIYKIFIFSPRPVVDTNGTLRKLSEERDYWKSLHGESEGVIEKYAEQFKEVEEKYSSILRNSVEKFEKILKERDAHIQQLETKLRETEEVNQRMQVESEALRQELLRLNREEKLRKSGERIFLCLTRQQS